MQNFNPTSTELTKGINLIEASAGTGKTFAIAMLVLRFVVEQQFDIKQILVVTFTKAATEELKDRIRNRLLDARHSLINGSASVDAGSREWLNTLDIEPQLILQRINNALLDIDQSGIFTIHGFCQRMLAEYALESGQLFDSEITADLNSIKQSSADDFWRKNIYLRSTWESALLTRQYKTPDQLLTSVDFISADQKIVPDYEDIQHYLDTLKQTVKQNRSAILLSLEIIQENFTEEKFKPSYQHNFIHDHKVLLDWLLQKNTLTPDFGLYSFQGLLNGLNGHKFRKSKARPESSDEQKKHYIASLNIDFTAIDTINLAIKKCTLVFRRALLESLHQGIKQKLQQLNLLSFDDLINHLAEALQAEKDSNRKTLVNKIQLQYQAALIDEFQDTDQNQWFIFSTLFNSPTHALYLIGDPKQAIYKFRGADIHCYFAAKKTAHQQFSLGLNWRSQPKLVEGINTLFSIDNAFFSDYLEFHPVKAALTSEQGELKLEQQTLSPLVLWQLDKSEKEFWTSGKAVNEIKTAIINEIIHLLNADFFIVGAEKKPVHAQDIAILVRTNPQAQEFQQALNEAGITAVINSKQSVFSSQEATDLYILLLAVSQPSNISLFKQALTLDWFHLKGQQLFQTINDQQLMDSYLSRFQNYLQIWQNKGLMAMMQNLLAEESILPHLSTHLLAERRITNLQHCIELVQQIAIDDHLGINKTLDWLQQSITQYTSNLNASDEQQLRLESDDDAVKIITMHSSKGLEYPIVFCPFLWQRGHRLEQEKAVIKCHANNELIVDLGSENFEQHRSIALQEELAEDLRVCYVALTRAKYRCYINWADVRSKDKINQSALAYLLGFSTADFAQQSSKLQQLATQQPLAFEYRLLTIEQEISDHYQTNTQTQFLHYQKASRVPYSHWQMSSYTALSALSIHEIAELPNDKAREETINIETESVISELPKGSHTGNVIHDLLENIAFSELDGNKNISLLRDKACLRYGLKTDSPELVDQLLKQTVSSVLSTDDNSFKLKLLNENQCLKEMPFYLKMKTIDVDQINQILKDCPTFQALSEKQMSGYLTGFIDLICEHQGQYYVMDYKSNSLNNYDNNTLIEAMKVHNYGLQYWIYTLVLHQYLINRLPDYNYMQHFGGVKYLFVRGMNENIQSQGIYQTKPEENILEQLSALFIS